MQIESEPAVDRYSHWEQAGPVKVLLPIVLIAMAGLIIDGGMALSNRRQVQNAADAAALAGTRVLGLDLKWRADHRPPVAEVYVDVHVDPA